MECIAKKTKANFGSFRGKWNKVMPVLFFAAVLFLYMTMLPDGLFVDEADVFYGGYNVVFSGDVYKVYPSQHMPFSYYMAAICALFGAVTAYQFRLGFYVMMAVIWTAIYVHHRKHLNNWALMGLPFFYIFQLKLQEFPATTMISDHWQGIGLVMLILEVLRYRKTWRIPVSSAVFVSLGIVLSFGTAFVSAFSVFSVFVGVSLMQAFRLWKHKDERKMALWEDLRLVGICIAPFAVLILWYWISGNLENSFGGAYTLNVDIYSKYINGFGSNASTALAGTSPAWINYIKKGINLLSINPQLGAVFMLQNLSLIVFCIVLMRKHLLAGLTVLVASVLAGVRAFDGFHGAPYIAVCSIPMAFWFGTGLVYFAEKRDILRGINVIAGIAAVVLLVYPSKSDIHKIKDVPRYLNVAETDETNLTIQEVLTDAGDRILTDDMAETGWMVMSNHLKLEEGSIVVSNPWFNEYYGERALKKLKENKPIIALIHPESKIWGYPKREYAAEYIKFIEDNYFYIESAVYVLRERLPEAIRKIEDAGYGLLDSKEKRPGFSELGNQLSFGEHWDEHFLAQGNESRGVRVRTATYYGTNRVGLTCEILDGKTLEIIGSFYRGKNELKDNEYVRFPMPGVSLEVGKEYIIRLRADKTSEYDDFTMLHIYQSKSGTATEQNYAVIDETSKDYQLAVYIEYAANENGEIIGKKALEEELD